MSTYEQFVAVKNLGSAVSGTAPAVVVAAKNASGNAAPLRTDADGNLNVNVVVGGGGGGGSDATAANQVTGNNSLAAILAKIIAAPATEAKQDTTITSLGTIDGHVDGLEAGVGAPADAAAGADTGTLSIVSMIKRGLARWTTLLALLPASIGQKVKAASFPVTIASDDDLLAKIGEVQASPTTNTVLDRLKAIATALTAVGLAAGSAIIGKVGIDQSTPGTTDRATVGKTVYVDVILTLDTLAYASGDLLADTQVITNMTRVADFGCILQSVTVIDEDDQGAAFDIYFLDANNTFGTENSAPSITDANARAILGKVSIGTGDYADLGGARCATVGNVGLVLQPASATRNGYLAVVNGTGTPTYTATGMRLRLGLLQD
jgi:hypothetical protein